MNMLLINVVVALVVAGAELVGATIVARRIR
jgi:hypothetical protein